MRAILNCDFHTLLPRGVEFWTVHVLSGRGLRGGTSQGLSAMGPYTWAPMQTPTDTHPPLACHEEKTTQLKPCFSVCVLHTDDPTTDRDLISGIRSVPSLKSGTHFRYVMTRISQAGNGNDPSLPQSAR